MADIDFAIEPDLITEPPKFELIQTSIFSAILLSEEILLEENQSGTKQEKTTFDTSVATQVSDVIIKYLLETCFRTDTYTYSIVVTTYVIFGVFPICSFNPLQPLQYFF